MRAWFVVNEETTLRLHTIAAIPWIAAFSIVIPAPPVAAAEARDQAPPPDEAGASAATAVDQVVVSANRAPMLADRVGQSFTILTRPRLEQDQETSVSDLLARTPGVSFDRNGGPGQTTLLFIRGADSDQTVTLIDGVKVNDPSAPGAGYDFSTLVTGDIARLEVLRGPQSTLYGSQAIGGVVNIVTTGATKPIEGVVQAEGGSYGTYFANGAVGGKQDRYDWRLGGYANGTQGVPCFDRAFGGRRPCGFHTVGLSGRFHFNLTSSLQLDQRAYYSRSRTEFDGFDTPTGAFGDDQEYGHARQFVNYTGLNLSLLDGRLKNRLAYEYTSINRDNQDPQQFGSSTTFTSQGHSHTVEYEGALALAPGYQAVFGAQSERSSLFAFAPVFQLQPSRGLETINSGYGLITGAVLPGLTLTVGGRYDEQSIVGGHFTGQASAAWRLNGGHTILRASFGQGFKAPSLYQLYSEFGNLDLKPEQADGWDAGIEQRFLEGRLAVQATYFGRATRNLIDFVSCFGVTTGRCAANVSGGYYDNIARARAEGLELQATWRVSTRFDVSGNYTLDDVEDRSFGSPQLGKQLARRPKNTANFNASYLWPINLRTDIAVRYAGDSYNDAAHANTLKRYALVDVRLSYPIWKNLEIYGRIENLANKHYETVYQYGTLGRAAYAGVRLRF